MNKTNNKRKISIRDITSNDNPLTKVVELNEKELLLVTGGFPPQGGTSSGSGDSDE